MPKYKVLKPIEHDNVLYLPAGSDAPETVKSVGHGEDIPVDASGFIDLTPEQAAQMTCGQIEGDPAVKAQAAAAPPRRMRPGTVTG